MNRISFLRLVDTLTGRVCKPECPIIIAAYAEHLSVTSLDRSRKSGKEMKNGSSRVGDSDRA